MSASKTERVLGGSPGMLPMFVKAGAAMIPGASRLPFVGGGGRAIPELALTLADVSVDRDRLAAYDRVCGFTLRDVLPATYPHMLAFPLHLKLMTDPSFPFPAIGLVHVYNRITQHRPIDAGERLSITVHSGPLRPHPRGQQFDVISQARAGDEVVWEEVSTNLRRGRPDESAQAPDVASAQDLPASATWRLPGDLGRRYASVSGDFNPIHIHPLTARLFGFNSAIAHGMWTKARCLAALQERLPAAYTVEVAFKRPILLPARVEFTERLADTGIAFGVRDARQALPHLDGDVRFG
ncbi:MAG TPA: MaoC/PaaZ C-terminal domain-containing protein [Solirubrobacteraceae bacterium]|nr:MaoC/PaaZ C-terminal domain-containing protein [Solirubrobacteraceae bacterium]